MARLYANENFPLPVVKELRLSGHDVLTVHESGKSGQPMPDEEVLEFATSDERVLLTLNRKHFIRLHKTQSHHAGLIVCSFDPDFKGQADRINAVIQSGTNLSGELIRINCPNQ